MVVANRKIRAIVYRIECQKNIFTFTPHFKNYVSGGDRFDYRVGVNVKTWQLAFCREYPNVPQITGTLNLH